MSVCPRWAQMARESMAKGVMATLWARMASAMPGTSRSATSRVASGVTSRSERPEPPQVSTMSASVLSQASMSAPAMNGRSSISTTRRTHSQPCSAMSCSSFCPASSVSKVRVSEHVMIANLMVTFTSFLSSSLETPRGDAWAQVPCSNSILWHFSPGVTAFSHAIE